MIKNICIREEREEKGETKVSWNKIGILIETNGKQYVKMYHIPNTLAFVFEQKDREQKPAQEATINVDETENVPF